MRIVRKTREQLIHDGYKGQLAEKERIIVLLAEQVEYLRAQLGMPTNTVSMAAAPIMPPPEDEFPEIPDSILMTEDTALSDDEEQLLAMKQAGVLDDASYEEAVSRLKSGEEKNIIE